MTNNPLYQLMNPKSIAVVGAGNNPTKMGTLHALSIVKEGYPGKFYPVHPRDKIVLGHQAYATVQELPEAPELAILIVPSSQALQLLEDFAKIGTKRAIIVTAGFRETGSDGAEKEAQLKDIAARYGVRFLGPNCIGMINSEISLNTTVMPGTGQPGKLGMASQSGTYVTQTLPYLRKKGIHFSKAISVGNEADIDIVDALEYLGEDEQTTAIALYIEGIKDGQRFIDVAQKITPHKPVIVQYVGGSAAGARAGMSHTGSMAGPDFLYEGIFKQAGVIRVNSVEDLYGHGWALATQPRLKGNRIAVVTNSGGPGTAVANECENGGLDVPRFSEALQEKIREHIFAHATSTNPVDLTFHLDAKVLTTVIPEIIMQSGEVDGVIMHGGMSHGFLSELYPHIKESLGGISLEMLLSQYKSEMAKTLALPEQYATPLLTSSFFGREDNYTTAFLDHGIPVFDSPEKAAKAMATLLKYQKIRERKKIQHTELPKPSGRAAELIARARQAGQEVLDEYQAKQLLSAYGIPVVTEILACSEEEVVAAAHDLGFPVVLKGCSAEIAHKTEKGVVYLNLASEEAVRQSYRAIAEAAGARIPVIVAEMVKGSREFLAGMTRFPGFGPCIMFGLGGVFTEAIRDVTFRAAPLSESEAAEMVTDIRAKKLLGNFRGLPAVDVGAMASLLCKLGQIPLLHPEIAEIDINPIIIRGSTPIAVDALIVLQK